MEGLAAKAKSPKKIKKRRGRPPMVNCDDYQPPKQRGSGHGTDRFLSTAVSQDGGRVCKYGNRTYYTGEVNHEQIYLPSGWKCYATRRGSGIHKGIFDLIYTAPTGERLRSRNEIFKWSKRTGVDVDPRKFLFARASKVLFRKENAGSIIFRNAGQRDTLNGVRRRNVPVSRLTTERGDQDELFNTIIAERGQELISEDNPNLLSAAAPLGAVREGHESAEKPLGERPALHTGELTASTPRKKNVGPAKPRRISDTLACLKSPYFAIKNDIPTKPVSILAVNSGNWIPPRSPYSLIQEDLYHNPWQLLIAAIFLNCTTGKLAIPIIHEFLARWPTPHEACAASLYDILEVVELLGLGRTRAATIIRFSHEFLTVDWKKPSELYGVGKYGNDSYKIFVLGKWRSVESDDKYLNLYINWMHNVFTPRPSKEHSDKIFKVIADCTLPKSSTSVAL